MRADGDTMTGAGPVTQRQTGFGSRFPAILFAVMIAVFCGWTLSLPLFPTQDGPMHKYYVHVLSSLLSGGHNSYGNYVVRHPLPPYATHYLVLLGLSRFVSLDSAEKIFICLIFLCTAYSLRYCARAVGPSGDLLSLCAIPLVLHWPLVMGFLNYSLALGLFFLAAGLWIRAASGQSRLWFAFLAVVGLMTITHPVPLLLLIAACSLDLLMRILQDRRRSSSQSAKQSAGQSAAPYRLQLFALAISCLFCLYPLASADRGRVTQNLEGIGFHKSVLISSMALAGVSPFDTRSRSFLINGYRLGLYAILVGCLILAGAGFLRRWKSADLGPGDRILVCTVLLLVAIPVLPEAMNGSTFFSLRLVVFPWLGAIAAASGFSEPRRLARVVPAFAILLAVFTLVPAEIQVRPVAKQLVGLEDQSLPAQARGLAVFDSAMLKAVRVQHQLGFDPYLWSGVLPFIAANGTVLNSPFMDQTITPLEAAPGGSLLIDRMSSPEDAERIIDGNVDLTQLPPSLRASLLAATEVIVYVTTAAGVQQGLSPLMGAAEASRYACAGHAFYLLCVARR